MPVIPILLSDTRRTVEYKIQLAGQVAAEQDAIDALELWRKYYAGNHDLLLNDDQRAFLANILSANGRFPVDNKLKVVVDKLRRRVNVQGFVVPGDTSHDSKDAQPVPTSPSTPAEYVWAWWHANKMDSGERELYRHALTDEWAYVVVGHDGQKPTFSIEERWDGTSGIRFFWEDAYLKRNPLYAVKHWYTRDPLNSDASNIERITLYTANAIYKWIRFTDKKQILQFDNVTADPDDTTLHRIQDATDASWPLPWTDAQGNPLGLAVVPFVAPMGSIIDGLIGLQDALNKTWIDAVTLADQQAFGQVVVSYPGGLPPNATTTTGSANGSKTTDDDGLGLRPGRILEIGGGAIASKLPADDMKGLLDASRALTTAIAGNSEMPLHYFQPLSGEVPSGAALDELSKPVSEVAEELTVAWSDAWQSVMVLGQRLDRLYGKYKGEPLALMPVWKPQPKSPETEANALQPLVQIFNAVKAAVESGASYEAAVEVIGGLTGLSKEQIVKLQAIDPNPPEQ